jgi:hypothetical protein
MFTPMAAKILVSTQPSRPCTLPSQATGAYVADRIKCANKQNHPTLVPAVSWKALALTKLHKFPHKLNAEFDGAYFFIRRLLDLPVVSCFPLTRCRRVWLDQATTLDQAAVFQPGVHKYKTQGPFKKLSRFSQLEPSIQ